MIKLKGVGEPSGSCEGPGRDPVWLLFLEDPSVVRCECSSPIGGGEGTKLGTSVPRGFVQIGLSRDGCRTNRCECEVV